MGGRIILRTPGEEDIPVIEQMRREFSAGGVNASWISDRIPGLDCLEQFSCVRDWLAFCKSQKDRISFFLSKRTLDGGTVGACCLRHKLEYDDDDPAFASHIGYCIRPPERRRGYGKEQLHLALLKAREAGIVTVRMVCRDLNEGSIRTILSNGGRYVDSVYGDESGMTVNRYDICTADL